MKAPSEERHWAPHCQVEARGSSTQGKGLFSCAQFKRGDVVFTERPAVASQAIDNLHLVTVCAHCHRTVGALSTQLARRAELAELELPLEPPSCQVVQCEAGCGEVYCSEQCRADAKAQGHALLCVGDSTEEDPLFVHKVHSMETNDVFLLAAKVASAVLTRCVDYDVVSLSL